MTTAQERALEIAWAMGGKKISRTLFAHMVAAPESGALRAAIEVIAKGIEEDREACALVASIQGRKAKP